MFKHILIPTDGSRLAAASAQAGVRLARALGARVTALFVAPPATPIIYRGLLPVGYATREGRERITREAARSYLGVIEKAARKAGVDCQVLTATGDFPAETIVEVAQKRRCDLVFMASHGRRGLRRASLLGSQTRKVLSQAPIPVLVHRG
jgi:nucleotide-binding universal stress UspA family protein